MRNVNIIHQVLDVTDISGGITEPVTVEQMKSYMRLQGFLDVDISGDVSFDDDDLLISSLIQSARELLEERLGSSIIQHTWSALLTNQAGMIQLPYGPVRSLTLVTDSGGVVYSTPVLRGDYLCSPCGCNYTAVYEAGYVNVPAALVTEIMRLVCYLYINRADETVEPFKYQLSSKFNRRSWLQ